MKLKEIRVPNVTYFMELFRNVDKMVEELKKSIGYEGKLGTKLTFGITQKNPMDYDSKSLAPFNMEIRSASKKEKSTKKIAFFDKTPYFVEELHIAGLHQHKVNTHMYLSISPDKLFPSQTSDISTEVDNTDKENPMTPALNHLLKILAGINNEENNKEIILIPLGDQNDNENFSFYSELVTPVSDPDRPLGIGRYKFSTTDDEGEVLLQGELNYIHATKDQEKSTLGLTSQDINFLYDIYLRTLGKAPTPIVFLCDTAIDRAAILPLAFEILSNFEKIFDSKLAYKNTIEFKLIYDTLRESISPVALSNTEDLSRAVYLAFGLVLRKMEKDLMAEFSTFLGKQNTGFKKHKDKIQAILASLADKPSYSSKAKELRTTVEMDSKEGGNLLRSHHNFPSIPGKVRPEPDHFLFIRTLQAIYDSRAEVDSTLAKVFNCVGELVLKADNGKEEDHEHEDHHSHTNGTNGVKS